MYRSNLTAGSMIFGHALQLTATAVGSVEPLTVAEAKDHMRVDGSDDDTEIGVFIEAARAHLESITRRSIIERTLRLDLPRFAHTIVLPSPPLVSVTSVKYYDTNNSLQTVTANDYEVNLPAREIELADNASWPDIYARHDAVQITYEAGYQLESVSPVASAPAALVHAMKMLVGDMYENREARSMLKIEDNVTFDRLVSPYIVGL